MNCVYHIKAATVAVARNHYEKKKNICAKWVEMWPGIKHCVEACPLGGPYYG